MILSKEPFDTFPYCECDTSLRSPARLAVTGTRVHGPDVSNKPSLYITFHLYMDLENSNPSPECARMDVDKVEFKVGELFTGHFLLFVMMPW